MKRATIDLLRCPKCLAGSLVSEDNVGAESIAYGPVKCLGCNARFPVSEGLMDCILERSKLSNVQQAMELPWVARSWERYLRPAFDALITRSTLDRDSEHLMTRSLLGTPQGAVVDLGCGPGRFVERLCAAFPDSLVIGLDASRPMLDEAVGHVREHGRKADFLRAHAPPLPFLASSIGAVTAVALVHFVDDLQALLAEVARVLRPKGRFVASSYLKAGAARTLHQRAGLFPREEEELRSLSQHLGFIDFERVRVGPMLLWKIERP